METMKTLAENGRIVVAVIHQPRSSIFALFDRLLLLSEGRAVFFGPAKNALQYFQYIGFPCPEHFNPADFFLDILSIDVKSLERERESTWRLEKITNEWKNMRNSVDFDSGCVILRQPPLQGSKRSSREITGDPLVSWPTSDMSTKRCCPSWIMDFQALFWRSTVDIYRNYGALSIRGLTTLFFAVLISLIYRGLGDDQRSIQNRVGLLYFVLINQVRLTFLTLDPLFLNPLTRDLP